MSSPGQEQVGADGATMAEAIGSAQQMVPATTMETTNGSETFSTPSSAPKRPAIPPRMPSTGALKRSNSGQYGSTPVPPARPSLPKITPLSGPKKSPVAGELPPIANRPKLARPPSVNTLRPLPQPPVTETPSTVTRSSTPPPAAPPPATPSSSSASDGAPSHVSGSPPVAAAPASHMPQNRISPGPKRPLAIVPQSAPQPSAAPPKVGPRPATFSPRGSNPVLPTTHPTNTISSTSPPSDSPLAATSPTSPRKQAPVIPTRGPAPLPPTKPQGMPKMGAPVKTPLYQSSSASSISVPATSPPVPIKSPLAAAGASSRPTLVHSGSLDSAVAQTSSSGLISLQLDDHDDQQLEAMQEATGTFSLYEEPPTSTLPSATVPTPSSPPSVPPKPASRPNLGPKPAHLTSSTGTESKSPPQVSVSPLVISPRSDTSDTVGEVKLSSDKSPPPSLNHQNQSQPLSVSPPATLSTSPTSTASIISPRMEGFTSGVVKPTRPNRPVMAFGSRSAAAVNQSPPPATTGTNSDQSAQPSGANVTQVDNGVFAMEMSVTEPVASVTPSSTETTRVEATPEQSKLNEQLRALEALQAMAGGSAGYVASPHGSPATISSMEANAEKLALSPRHPPTLTGISGISQISQNTVSNDSSAPSTMAMSVSTPRSALGSATSTPRGDYPIFTVPSTDSTATGAGDYSGSSLNYSTLQTIDESTLEGRTTFGEGTLPPPPPEGYDGPDGFSFDGEGNQQPQSQYTTILEGQLAGTPGSTFAMLSVLGREDQTGPPPPGLAPLPDMFHPKVMPPALPAGVVHPDSVQPAVAQSTPAPTDTTQQEDKKKKKPFGGLFGGGKDTKDKAEKQKEKEAEKEQKEREKREKEEREKREKEEKKAAKAADNEKSSGSGLMSGLKKMGQKIGGLGGSGSNSTTSGSSNALTSSGGFPAQTNAIGSEGPSPLRDRLDLYSRLMELLCRPDLHLMNITASLVKRGDVDKQSRAWVHLLTPKGRMVDLLGKVIFTEVDKTDHEGTLFRNNTFSVGLMSAFAHEVGRGYLKQVLGPLLQQILTSGRNYEINPEKADGGATDEDTIDNNTINLIEACGAYVNAIVTSLPDVPLELRRVCSMLRQFVQVKFPNSVNTCVGGFFFLRFLTPAVVSPEGFGVHSQDDPISIEARRPLILISKTLQQISNEMYFSEDHMMSLNSFITENIPAFQQFFQDICSPTAEEPAPPQFVPYTYEANKTRDDSLIKLHAFLHKSLPEIKAVAQVEPAPPGMTYDPIAELEKILNDLGDPPDAKILKAPANAAPASTALPSSGKRK